MDLTAIAAKLDRAQMQQLVAVWCVLDATKELNEAKRAKAIESFGIEDVVEMANAYYDQLATQMYKDESIRAAAETLDRKKIKAPYAVLIIPTEEQCNVLYGAVLVAKAVDESKHKSGKRSALSKKWTELVNLISLS